MSMEAVVGRAPTCTLCRATPQSDYKARIAERSHLINVRDVEAGASSARRNLELAIR